LTKKPVDLSDDGELSQPVAYDEKPKRKRGESRSIRVPIYAVLLVLAIMIIFGIALFAMSLVLTNPLDMPPEVAAELVTQMAFGAPSPTPIGNCSAYPLQGERVAYVDITDNTIYILNPTTGNRCAFMTFQDAAHSLALSPHGERMAFALERVLYMSNLADGVQTSIAPSILSFPQPLAWSPDGEQIAFRNPNDSAIYLVNTDGTNMRRLINGSEPAWSPDGNRIAYVHEGYMSLMNADGSNAHRVTNSVEHEAFPVWSPDGTRILFARVDTNDMLTQVYTVNPDDPQKAHQLIAENLSLIDALDWVSEDRFAYLHEGELHTRLFPPNDGSNGDTVIAQNVFVFDWWTP